jgi:alpha-glucosidase
VVYQVYPRSFADANGDGVGDLKGITNSLNYLEWLGVDAVWICPFYRSPMRDFGYDVSDHCDVDPLFGTLSDFDGLIEEAHARGIRVVVDFVPNHTSDEHPWFVESRSSRESPKRDWYVWRDPKPDGGPPNNWLSYWGGSAWEFDEQTDQYYLHSFMAEMPDLDWRNEEVEEAMLGVARFWLERGVDGFRVDSAQQIMKDPELRDNPTNPDAGKSAYKYLGGYDAQLHLHDKGHEDVHKVYRRFRALLDEYGGRDGRTRLAMGEIHVFDRPEWARHWASYYGADLDEFHVPFNLTLVGRAWEAAGFRRVVEEMEAITPPGAWPNWVLGNHDEPRIASRVGRERARVAMMLLLTLRGTPTIYYGDEIGMKDVPVPPDKVRDPFEKGSPGMGLGRDPERSPMQWDAGPNAGFCPKGAEPWLPVADDYEEVNVAAQKADPRSVLSLTRHLLALRRDLSALAEGSYEPIVRGVPADCMAYLRRDGEGECLVALNFSGEWKELRLLGQVKGRVAVSTRLDREGTETPTPFGLRAYEGCVLELRHRGRPADGTNK